MDYEVYEPTDDTPLEVAYAQMFSSGLYYNPCPNYAIEVTEHEDYHEPYYLDFAPVAAG